MGKGHGLREIPEDVYKFILQEQNKVKNEKGVSRWPFAEVIYDLLRELQKIRGGKKWP